MDKKRSQQGISAGMHYTTLAALLVSNFTVLALGALMSNNLLAGGMTSILFDSTASKIQHAQAATKNLMLNVVVDPIKYPEEPGTPPTTPILEEYYRVYQWGILIYWNQVQNVDYYQVERFDTRYSEKDWRVIGTRPTCDPTQEPSCSGFYEFVDTDADIVWPQYPDFEYLYRLVAVNKYGSSMPSNSKTIVPFYDSVPPAAPEKFAITSQECKIFNGDYRTLTTFTWTPVAGDNPEKGAVGGTWYKLYRSTTPNGSGYVQGGVGNDVTTYTDYSPSSSQLNTYYRWIVNVDANENESVPSSRIKVSVPPCPQR